VLDHDNSDDNVGIVRAIRFACVGLKMRSERLVTAERTGTD
jgi:hypothetical protein